MQQTSSKPLISFHPTYKQITLYKSDQKDPKHYISTHHSSPNHQNISQLFSNYSSAHLNQKQQSQIYYCAQPFYVGQVNHSIQEIGLMAVKEVRYVDDAEWEQMIKEHDQYMKALEKYKFDQIREIKKNYAKSRNRNEKGQFIKNIEKNKQIKKKQKFFNLLSKKSKSNQNSSKSSF